jgi:peptidase E
MKLFLTSEGKDPESMGKLKNYFGDFKGKSIAYIPTATNGLGYGSWREGSTWKLVNSLGADVTLVELEEYRDESVIEVLKGKDIIWVNGGMGGYLLYWMRRCKIDRHIKEILEKDTLYVGSSSGAMITSHDQTFSEWYIGEEEPGVSVIPGLGLVDFDFYPHYDESLYDEIKKRYTGKKMYLVKNGEVIIVEDGSVKVLGEERVISN